MTTTEKQFIEYMIESIEDSMSDDLEFKQARVYSITPLADDKSYYSIIIKDIDLLDTYLDIDSDDEMRTWLIEIPLIEFPEGFDLHLDKIEKIEETHLGFYNITFTVRE